MPYASPVPTTKDFDSTAAVVLWPLAFLIAVFFVCYVGCPDAGTHDRPWVLYAIKRGQPKPVAVDFFYGKAARLSCMGASDPNAVKSWCEQPATPVKTPTPSEQEPPTHFVPLQPVAPQQ